VISRVETVLTARRKRNRRSICTEINSQAIGFPAGEDWTNDNAATQQYDGYKVHAIVNEIDGYDHSGRHRTGTPAIFGMNFQSVSTAEKLPVSDGLVGGYLPGGTTPAAAGALARLRGSQFGRWSPRSGAGLANSTTIIISAKHGQSAADPAALTRVRTGRSSARSMRRGNPPTRAPLIWSPSPPTTTSCSSGSPIGPPALPVCKHFLADP